MTASKPSKKRFLGLRWKAALFITPIILFSEVILIKTQYNDLTKRFQAHKEELQRERLHDINISMRNANEKLVETAIQLYEPSSEEESMGGPENIQAVKSKIDELWNESSENLSLSSISLIDTKGKNIGHWGEPSNSPLIKWTRMVIEREAPVSAIDCNRMCSMYASIPIMVNENIGGVMVISRTMLDFIFELNELSGDDVGIIKVENSLAMRLSEHSIENWNARVKALTNKDTLLPILNNLSEKQSLEQLSRKGHIYEYKVGKDLMAYSILTIPITHQNSENYLLVLSNISSDYRYIQLNINKMIFTMVFSTLILLVVLLTFLWRPILYLRKQSSTLPLLAKGAFKKFRSEINRKPFKLDPFDDELDTLDTISLELSDQLEKLEKEVRVRTHELEQYGLHDTLTGLPNRRHFIARLKHALQLAKRNNKQTAVMFIDIDHFKRINDSLGHERGDQLLIEVSRRLESCVRKSDTVARLGGDEFAIIVSELARDLDAGIIANTIIDSINAPIIIGHQSICVTPSIGISVAPDNGEDAETLLRYADLAMYKSKGLGRYRYHFYTPSMHQAAQTRLETENELRHAIDKNEFEVYLQAQIDLLNNSISGFESLLRWKHGKKGMVFPDQFIPVLEDTGLIVPVGEFVLKESCDFLKFWLSQGYSPVKMAINISPRQFQDNTFSDRVKEIIGDSKLPPELIELEITESLLMEDIDKTLETLMDLRSFGVSIAIDDFGTGYSSLGYLYKFPVQYLKIDRSFLMDVPKNYNNSAITAAVIAMAHKLNIDVVAEGIENTDQIAFLKNHRCNFGQGYFYSKPIPKEEILEAFPGGALPEKTINAILIEEKS